VRSPAQSEPLRAGVCIGPQGCVCRRCVKGTSLVGVTHECDYPRGIEREPALTSSRITQQTMSSAEIDHALRSQLDGHGSIYELDTNRLRLRTPDLILAQELCEVCAVSYRTVERAVRRPRR
jgi:iron complex transport system substrate-binding protein